MTELTIRNFCADDADAVLRLNAANVPEVGAMGAEVLLALAQEAEWLPVAYRAGELVGFAILLGEDASYESPNYRFFAVRHERFLYVDRIAIAEGARGQGLGQSLYGGALERARRGHRPVLCAEVNTVPPNPASTRFHAAFGFREVARARPYDPEGEVAMLEREVAVEPASGATSRPRP